MAEELYKFFSTVFTKEDISTVPMLPSETEKRFQNIEVTEEKIKKKN